MYSTFASKQRGLLDVSLIYLFVCLLLRSNPTSAGHCSPGVKHSAHSCAMCMHGAGMCGVAKTEALVR